MCITSETRKGGFWRVRPEAGSAYLKGHYESFVSFLSLDRQNASDIGIRVYHPEKLYIII